MASTKQIVLAGGAILVAISRAAAAGGGDSVQVEMVVRSASTQGLSYTAQVDAESAPELVTGGGDDAAGDSGDEVTSRGDGTFDISGATGSVSGDQSFGDTYRWTTTTPDFGILGWEASLPASEYEIAINDSTVDPGQFDAWQPPSDGGNGGPSPDEIPLGGGAGYENIISESEADFVVSSSAALDNALSSAGSGDIIYIDPGSIVNIGASHMDIPSGVTIASNRGQGGSLGGMIATNDPNDHHQFVDVHSNVRVTGLRFRGPYHDRRGGDTVTGMMIQGDGVEIDNCEMYGFAEGAILFQNGDGRVHHNHIHSNTTAGYGYGVTVGFTGHAGRPVIEYNYFDRNRHSIVGNGGHEDGYVCQFNHFGPHSIHHVIDVHDPANGDYVARSNIVEAVDAMPEAPRSSITGIAGWDGPAQFLIEDNWFFHDSINDALDSDARNHGTHRNNTYGADAQISFGDVIPGHPGDPPWTQSVYR